MKQQYAYQSPTQAQRVRNPTFTKSSYMPQTRTSNRVYTPYHLLPVPVTFGGRRGPAAPYHLMRTSNRAYPYSSQ